MINASQCRAARGLLNWTQDDLAKAAKVGVVTVRQFEGGNADPRNATLVVIRQALEAAGAEFIAENGGGAGVRLKKARMTSDAAEIKRIEALDDRKDALNGKDVSFVLQDGRTLKGRCFVSIHHGTLEPRATCISFLLETNPGEVFIDALDVVNIEEEHTATGISSSES